MGTGNGISCLAGSGPVRKWPLGAFESKGQKPKRFHIHVYVWHPIEVDSTKVEKEGFETSGGEKEILDLDLRDGLAWSP